MNTQHTQRGMTTFAALAIIILLAVVGAFVWNKEDTAPNREPKESGEEQATMSAVRYVGTLADVTEGNDVRGINTEGDSTGLAQAVYKDGSYELTVAFENLPDPVGDDFYEGWVVRKGVNSNVISSGALKKVDGFYVNNFGSDEDLTDHDFYVLTLEPNDGDPAPADHILEGTLIKQ